MKKTNNKMRARHTQHDTYTHIKLMEFLLSEKNTHFIKIRFIAVLCITTTYTHLTFRFILYTANGNECGEKE